MVILIEILFVIAFVFLLGKALIETVIGIGMIVHGLFWHGVALALNALAFLIRTAKKLFGFSKKSTPRVSVARGLAHVYRK